MYAENFYFILTLNFFGKIDRHRQATQKYRKIVKKTTLLFYKKKFVYLERFSRQLCKPIGKND